jgi:phosphatidate cytidylyltransferase
MKQRTITSIILIGIFVPLFVLNGVGIRILLGLFTVVASYEITNLIAKEKSYRLILIILNGLMSLSLYILELIYLEFGDTKFSLVVLLLPIVLMSIYSIFIFKSNGKLKDQHFMYNLVAVVYPAIGFAALFMIRDFGFEYGLGYGEGYWQGNVNIGSVFLVTVLTDTFGYFTGMLFGKTPLAPKISPKKTIEGAIGGTLTTAIVALLLSYYFENASIGVEYIIVIPIDQKLSILVFFVFASIVAQIGDLLMSSVKRQFNVKDFSNVFPGHGGVLDRFDSMLLTSLFMIIFSKIMVLL